MEKKEVYVVKKLVGSILAESVNGPNNIPIVNKGTIISKHILEKLMKYGIQRVYILSDKTEVSMHRQNEISRAQEQYKKSSKMMKNLMTEVREGKTINYAKVKEITHFLYEGIERYTYVLNCIQQLRNYDEYTYNHSINVAVYSMLLGRWLDLKGSEIKELVQAGVLHDIGKAKIDSKILNKKGKLSDEEYGIMKKHTVYGYDMIENMKELSIPVKNGVLNHHERLDGSGYPMGKTTLGLYEKIIAIADVYDALTSERVYKSKITPFLTIEEFKRIGYHHFDTRALMVFIENIGDYYIGSTVRMKDGRMGEIVSMIKGNKPIIKLGEEFLEVLPKDYDKILEVVL